MSKKPKFSYKNLKVNKEDLSITKIGEISTENKSPIFIILLFGILILFIFFLPTITEYFDKEENKNKINESTITEENNKTDEEQKKEEIIYYDLSSKIILEEGIEINNIIVLNDTITFTITNSNSESYYFNQKNYFMELYTENQMLLERIILTKDIIAQNNSKEFSYTINKEIAENIKKIAFINKNIDDYPNINFANNNEESITCIKNNEAITYKFQNGKLISIDDKIDYTQNINDFEYQTELALWQSRSTTYNNIEGVTSSFISNASGFNVNIQIDLSKAKLSSLNNENYYPSGTHGKVVKFEMEARGFNCN